ncbi:MAG: U32 family peptidase [Bacteroidales bacterium]|nr:U32 family peptidase [Bacteroidales bacterium]
MKKREIELMAPVGSYESLMAAIKAGADSVYFGLNKLNMRARSAANFTENDLDKIMKICNEHKVKAYLTLNIILYNNELEQAQKLVDLARENGISAIIASDHAIINYARSRGVEVHISTQVNISNTESLKFYSDYADVIVLARELNLDQVNKIYKQINQQDIKGPSGELVKIELFVHGALCMSVSGKCYLSLHEQNYSANRGACLQNCRKAYTVTEQESGRELDIENEYIMSPKDLCTIHFLNKILDAGVSILKIEGRARPPEYVYTVVKCYREAIESCFDGSYNKEKIQEWQEQLKTVFNRGFWDGYYLGQKLGEWSPVYGSKATERKIYVGKGMNYFSKKRVAEFLCEASELRVNDDILITGPTTGIIRGKVKEIRVDLKKVNASVKGERFSFPFDEMIRRSDKLYKIVNASDVIAQNSNGVLK